MEATLTSKGQVTLPIAIREELGISKGDKLIFDFEDDGRLVVTPKPKKTGNLADLFGCVPWDSPPVTIEEMNEAIEQGAVERYERAVRRDP